MFTGNEFLSVALRKILLGRQKLSGKHRMLSPENEPLKIHVQITSCRFYLYRFT